MWVCVYILAFKKSINITDFFGGVYFFAADADWLLRRSKEFSPIKRHLCFTSQSWHSAPLNFLGILEFSYSHYCHSRKGSCVCMWSSLRFFKCECVWKLLRGGWCCAIISQTTYYNNDIAGGVWGTIRLIRSCGTFVTHSRKGPVLSLQWAGALVLAFFTG